MRKRYLAPLLLLAAVSCWGCAAGVTYRVHDPYYGDYHVWTDAELPHYHAWVAETHHPNVDYGRLPKRDKEEYWGWRHEHP